MTDAGRHMPSRRFEPGAARGIVACGSVPVSLQAEKIPMTCRGTAPSCAASRNVAVWSWRLTSPAKYFGGPASSSASDISRLAACVLRSSRFKCIRLIRSRGRHGWLLVGDAVARARALGCYRLQLTSNGGRHDAQRFYERLGSAPQVGFKVVPRGESD